MSKGTTVVNKFKGNTGCLILLLFVFWPAALIYYLQKREPVEVRVKRENGDDDDDKEGRKKKKEEEN